MNLNCDITKDLVSLYKDGIVSRATKIEILKHLCQCPDCRKYYRAYDKFLEDFDEISESEHETASHLSYSEVAKKVRKNNTIQTLLFAGTVAAAIGVTAVVFKLATKQED